MSESLTHHITTDIDTIDEERILEPDETQVILNALVDSDCRQILKETKQEPKSVNEIVESCDISMSTAYRKINTLTEAGLLHERTRAELPLTGNHPNEYLATIQQVSINMDGEEELTITAQVRDND